MKALLLDTETTGFKHNELIQLAYKNLENGDICNAFFSPDNEIEYGAMAIHHITPEKIQGASKFKGSKEQKKLKELVEEQYYIIIAHNAPYDLDVLKNAGIKTGEYICTQKCSQHLLKDRESYKLQALRYSENLNNPELDKLMPHDALSDILVLEQLFIYLSVNCKAKNSDDMLNKLIELTKKPLLLDKMPFGKYKDQTFEDIVWKQHDINYLDWLMINLQDLSDDMLYTLQHHISEFDNKNKSNQTKIC